MVGRCQNLQGVRVQRVCRGSIGPAVAVMVLRRQVVSGVIVTWRGFMFAGSPVLHGVLLQRQRIILRGYWVIHAVVVPFQIHRPGLITAGRHVLVFQRRWAVTGRHVLIVRHG